MRIRKLLIGFGRYSDAALLAFSQAVKTAMTDNTNFPTPQPSMVVFGAGITDFENAMADAASGDRSKTAIKNQMRAALVILLQQLAGYVELIAAGDDGMLLSSGFLLGKVPTPVGPLPKPENFEVRPAQKGQLKLSLKAIYGARIYRFEYKKISGTSWIQVDSSASRILLTDLESGAAYVARVLPIGKSDVRTYSDEISAFAN